MSVVSTFGRATTSGNRTRYTAGALTLAVAAGVSAGSVAVGEAPHAEQTAFDAAPDQAKVPNVAAPTFRSPAPTSAPLAKAPAPVVTKTPVTSSSAPDGQRPAHTEPSIEQVAYVQRFSNYPNNLDGWIRASLEILRKNNIPASYAGIHRNIMRESTGNPRAINLYDSNAAAGTPSKGLLQVIDPTFAAYHVKGTPFNIWDPVANIVAACNYAAHNYGSMDNVNSAY